MPRKAGGQAKPTPWQRESPQKNLSAPTREPEPLNEIGPLEGPGVSLPPKFGRNRASEKTIRKETSRQVIERMLDDPLYLQTLEERMRKGKLPPPVETLFWQLVHGRPPDSRVVNPDKPAEVRIIHEFTKIADEKVESGG